MMHGNAAGSDKSYPIDLESIGDFSVFEESFSLPDAAWRMHKLRTDLFDSYYEAVNRYADSEIGDILLLSLKTPMEYIRALSFLWISGYAAAIGRRVACSKKSWFHSDGDGLSRSRILDFGSLVSGCRRYSRLSRMKREIRNALYNVRVNGRIDYYFRSFANGKRIANTNPGGLDLQYLKNLGKSFFYLDESVFFEDRNSVVLPEGMGFSLKNLGDELVVAACKVAEKHGIEVPGETASALSKNTLRHLVNAANDILATRHVFRRRFGSCLLLGGTNCGYFNRLASLLNRRNGGEVVVFPHGNEVGRIRDYRMETSLATEFATYNRQSVEDIGKSIAAFTPLHGNIPKLSSLEASLFDDLLEREKNKPLPERVKSIMLIGFAFSINLNMDKVFPDIAYFHAELKLIKLLLKAGYTVLYKLHPDSVSSVPKMPEILGRLGNELGPSFKVVSGPFENNMKDADAFLFSYSSTTTFNWALCARKPVVLIAFDEFVRPHSDEALRLLSGRCAVIPHSFDEKNRVVFDEERLLRAFAGKPTEPDMEFQRKYLLRRGS